MTRPAVPPSRSFEMQLGIAVPRDLVWKAITDDAELRRWFCPEARLEPRVGGEVLWRWGELYSWPQRIEAFEPGRHLRTRYSSAVDDGAGGRHPLFVDLYLEGEGGRTTLRLVHSGFGPEAAFDQEFDGISGGWPVELRSLRLYLERHAGEDRHLAWSTFATSLPREEAWRRVTGADGLSCGPRIDALHEGEPFRIRSATADVFEGQTLHCHRFEFSGVERTHDDGFLRISVEPAKDGNVVWLWLAAYGAAAASLPALQARWDAMLARLFQGQGAGARHEGAHA